MRILQQHLDFIEYEPIGKEIKSAEELTDQSKKRYEEIVAIFVSVEQGDDAAVAKQAVDGIRSFLEKLKVKKVIIYPYAHLSSNLAKPLEALEVLKAMETMAREAGLETYRSPFGWNKAFTIKVKGHPLAEQSRFYSNQPQQPKAVAAPVIVTEKRQGTGAELSPEQLFARVKKSDFGDLPETDHRIIGEKLDLFSFQEPSPGMVFWHDKGLKIRNLLVGLSRSEERDRGYIEISTPSITNVVLWKVSGHWDHYRDNLFLTKVGEEDASLKPMNCPATMLFYRTRRWSYRDLPLRVACFDSLYRNELSGVATGLFRVKMFSQDDGHIFVTEDQIAGEVSKMIDFMTRIYGIFGLEFSMNISTMPDDHLGSVDLWERATESLVKALKSRGLEYNLKEKDGAFYGPKIDVDVKDSMGRKWQCGTIQLDYQMPSRFKLTYVSAGGAEQVPVVIHRAIYGSLERFMGILIEHYQGKFPLWLAPVQVKVLTVSDEAQEYARGVSKRLKEEGLRVEEDTETGTIGGKIRNAQLQKIPYMLTLGVKERDAGTLAIRTLDGQVKYGVKLDDFVAEVKEKITTYA